MVRTQIQLTEEQASALRALAAAEGCSMAELIRGSVDRLLRQRGRYNREELRRRAKEAAGRFRSDLGDLAAEHDRYLDEAFAE